MKRAIVLSGGGSKGSYQIGVWKALRKLKINYDIVTGTSAGALNGILMVQKTYYRGYHLWKNMNFELLFSDKVKKDYTPKDLIKMYGKNLILNGGMNVKKLENIMRKKVNIKKFYHSEISYGLVAFNLTNLEPICLSKKEIEKEKLIDYLMATSACFPAFQMREMDGKKLIDGGIYDNMPINLAIDLGATEIIAVDLKSIGIKRKIKDKSIPITYIEPRNHLASLLIFDKKEAKRNIKFGYNDTMKTFHKLDGTKYTFQKGQLRKEIEHRKELFLKILKESLLLENPNDPIYLELLKNSLYKRLIKKQNLTSVMEEVIEYLGNCFEIDETTIYSIRKFHRILKKKSKKILKDKKITKQLQQKRQKHLLHPREMTLYLVDLIQQNNTSKKELIHLTTLFPKEFLSAVYLICIQGEKYNAKFHL